MTLDDIIHAINAAPYDDTPDPLTITEKDARAWCYTPPAVIKALVDHLDTLDPADVLRDVGRLTSECDEKRLRALNRVLQYEPIFGAAMQRLHVYRTTPR